MNLSGQKHESDYLLFTSTYHMFFAELHSNVW